MPAVVANVFFMNMIAQLVIVTAFVLFSSLLILGKVNAVGRGGETTNVRHVSLYVAAYNLSRACCSCWAFSAAAGLSSSPAERGAFGALFYFWRIYRSNTAIDST